MRKTGCIVSYLFTAESVRMVAMGDLMFFKSHTLTVRSSLPETTLSPAVNTADVTVLREQAHNEHVRAILSEGGSLNPVLPQTIVKQLQGKHRAGGIQCDSSTS